MTRYATAFKGLRIVTLDHRNKWKKTRGVQDALKAIRNGKLCSSLSTYARGVLKSADIVLLAYNSEGEVRGVAGVRDDRDDELYVSIICNDMGKENRRGGYAPGKGLLDLLKKIAVKRKKNLTLSSLNSALNFYKKFGFKQHPNSNNKTYLLWEWRPSYTRPRRFEYESVNSNYNSNSSNRSVSSNSNSNRSSATVKNSPTIRRVARTISPGQAQIKKELIKLKKYMKNDLKKTIKRFSGRLTAVKRSRHKKRDQHFRNYVTFLKNAKSSRIRVKDDLKKTLRNYKKKIE